MSAAVDVDYRPDALGIMRPVLTVHRVTTEALRTVNVRKLQRDAPPPAETLTRAPGCYGGVALAYAYFQTVGNSPTADLAALYGVPHTTAAKWAREARRRGLLEPTRRGAPSRQPTDTTPQRGNT